VSTTTGKSSRAAASAGAMALGRKAGVVRDIVVVVVVDHKDIFDSVNMHNLYG
jgi:hypothetical protein